MATPVVLTTGARPIVPVESGGVPMTPVDTLGEPVTVVDTLGEPVVLINNDGTPAFLAYSAKTYLGGVAPYHWLDFIANRALYASVDVGNVTQATGYSFTRASDGYYQNADGTLTLFGSGALRRGDRGVLIEGSRTNLLLRSQEFDNASWSKADVTVSANQYTAPDGTLTMDRMLASATNAAHYVSQTVTWTAAIHCVSYFVRYVNQQYFQITTWDGTTSRHMNFDILNGTVGTGGNATGLISAVSGGYRCVLVTSTNQAAAGGNVTATLSNSSSAAANPVINAAGTEAYGLWGAQLEAAFFPSSYIPTVAASATRAADSLSYTAGVSYPLQLWSEFERAVDTGAAETLLAIDNGTNNERVNLGLSAGDLFNLVLVKNAGGVDSVNTTVGSALSTGVTYKGATRVATNAVRPAFGGTLGTEDTAIDMPLAPTTIRIGANASGSQPFGYIRRIAVIQGAGTDANLQAMTS